MYLTRTDKSLIKTVLRNYEGMTDYEVRRVMNNLTEENVYIIQRALRDSLEEVRFVETLPNQTPDELANEMLFENKLKGLIHKIIHT